MTKPGRGDSFATVNDHQRRDVFTNAAAVFQGIVGCSRALSFRARFPPTLGLMVGRGELCKVLVEIQLSYLAENDREAKCACYIEGRDGYAQPGQQGDRLESVGVKGDDGREEEGHKGKARQERHARDTFMFDFLNKEPTFVAAGDGYEETRCTKSAFLIRIYHNCLNLANACLRLQAPISLITLA